MLTIKTIIDKFKALTTIKKVAVIIIILAVFYIIFKTFTKSTFGALSTMGKDYKAQTPGMSQTNFDLFMITQYEDLNLSTSTAYNTYFIIMQLVPIPAIGKIAGNVGDFNKLNDPSQIPPSVIATAVKQGTDFVQQWNNLITDLRALDVEVWNSSVASKKLAQISPNLQSIPNPTIDQIISEITEFQIAATNYVLNYLTSTQQPNYKSIDIATTIPAPVPSPEI